MRPEIVKNRKVIIDWFKKGYKIEEGDTCVCIFDNNPYVCSLVSVKYKNDVGTWSNSISGYGPCMKCLVGLYLDFLTKSTIYVVEKEDL